MITFIVGHYAVTTIVLSAAAVAACLAALDLGARAANSKKFKETGTGTAAVEGSVLALLGLLVALTFSGAVDRIDRRATLVIDESDSLGTAFLRLDVLEAPSRGLARRVLRDYTAARIAEVEAIPQDSLHAAAAEHTAALRDMLWDIVVPAAARSKYPYAATLIVPLLNECFDIAGRRDAIRALHPPVAVYLLLIIIALLSSLLAGYGMADRAKPLWLHRLSFCAAIGGTLFVTLNLEFPRLGLIHMGQRDAVLTQTLAEMDRQLARIP